eukprot:152966_1
MKRANTHSSDRDGEPPRKRRKTNQNAKDEWIQENVKNTNQKGEMGGSDEEEHHPTISRWGADESHPLEQIIPTDITQYMLSFAGFYHTKAVSTKWKQYSELNERTYFSTLYNSMHSLLRHKVNQTWIMHPLRKKLNIIEKNLGYQGPISDLPQTLGKCESNDRIFLFDGIYRNYQSLNIYKDVELIGIGSDVVIDDTKTDGDEIDALFWFYSRRVYLQNLTFDCSKSTLITEGAIHIRNGELIMKECKFTFKGIGISVHEKGSLNVEKCQFDQAATAIQISPIADSVVIKNSTFKHCSMAIDGYTASRANACIQVDDGYGDTHRMTVDDTFVFLECYTEICLKIICLIPSQNANIQTDHIVIRLW